MVRYILCKPCGENTRLNGQDVREGLNMRRLLFTARKPDVLQVKIDETVIDLPVLKCDYCNIELPDGTAVYAVTYWRPRREAEPRYWEEEYMAKPNASEGARQ